MFKYKCIFYKYFNDDTEYKLNKIREIREIQNPEKIYLLDLSNSNIHCLNKDILKNLTQLKELNLFNNTLRNIHVDTFKYNTKLKKLSLEHNKLTNLDKSIFKYNIELETIELSYNNLTNLYKDIFKYNTQLLIIHLSSNNLTNLDKDIFKYNTKLFIINLARNGLTNLDKDTFKNNTQLCGLYLGSNNIIELDKDIFKYNTQLERLSIHDNKLTIMPSSIILCRNLNSFHYRFNEFQYIPPHIQNFLNRIKQQSNKLQVYNDSQNVHNHQIQECIKVSLENILNIPKTINKEQLLDDIINNKYMNETSIQLLLEYCNDKSIHSILNINFEEALLHVLEYINLECTEHKIEIYKILADEIVESECKCFTGRISRLINCLNGFTPLVEVKIPENMELSNIIVMIKNNYNGDNVDELKEITRKELLERGYDNELITEYVEFVELD